MYRHKLALQESSQASAVVRITQPDSQFALNAIISDTFIIKVEACCHWAKFGLLYWNFLWRFHVQQFCCEGYDILWRGRFIITDIVNRAGIGLIYRGLNNGGDVIDVDSREYMPRLHNSPRRATTNILEGIAARAVDTG